jgi:hypothetical protein
VGLALALYIGMSWYFQVPVRQAAETWFPPSAWLPRATGGLVNRTLVACGTIQAVLVVGFLLGVCRFRPRGNRRRPRRSPSAIAIPERGNLLLGGWM